MAFARLLVEANEFIANETNTYQQHLRTIQSTNDSSEDALWEDYLTAQECEPPPAWFSNTERVVWFINKINPHPRLVLDMPERQELERASPLFWTFFKEKERILRDACEESPTPS